MIGYPVVMKVISQQVVHKTDAGGVILNIRSPAEATDAFETISRNVKEKVPGAVIDGIIVVQQLTTGLELIIGGKTDPTFGKVITIGAGGTLVELLRDVSIRVLPIDEYEIRTMVRETPESIASSRDTGTSLPATSRHSYPRSLLQPGGSLQTPVLSSSTSTRWSCTRKAGVRSMPGCTLTMHRHRLVPDEKTGPPGPAPHHPFHRGGRGIAGPEQGRVRDHAEPSLVSGVRSIPSTRRQRRYSGASLPVAVAIPENVDVAVVAIPANGVPQVVKEAGEKKIPLVIIISSGFREAGEAGRMLENRDPCDRTPVRDPDHGAELPRAHAPPPGDQHNLRPGLAQTGEDRLHLAERGHHHHHR